MPTLAARTNLSRAAPPLETSESADTHARNIVILIVVAAALGTLLVAIAGLVLFGWKRKDHCIGRFVRRCFCCGSYSGSDAPPAGEKNGESPSDMSPQSAAALATARPPSRLLQRPVSRIAMVEEGKRRVLARQAYQKDKETALLSAVPEMPEVSPMEEAEEGELEPGRVQVARSAMP